MIKKEIKQSVLDFLEKNSKEERSTLEENFNLFEKVLTIASSMEDFASMKDDINDAFAKEIEKPNLKLLCVIEPFCKVMVSIVDKSYYEEKKGQHFTLSTCIHKLKLLDKDVTDYLTKKDESGKPKIYASNDQENPIHKFRDHPSYPIIVAYYCRNVFSHKAPQIMVFDYFIFYINLFLAYFNIASRYKKEILSFCLNDTDYVNRYIKEYEDKEEAGFTYITTGIVKKGEHELFSSIKEKKFTEIHKNHTILCCKLIGYAGVGKTSILEYIRYKELVKYREGGNRRLPVIISLIDVTENNVTIESLIAKSLNMKLDSIELLLQEKKLNLYFDGINEIRITNQQDRKEFCEKLEQFIINYQDKRVSVIVTDRDNNGLSIFNDEKKTPTFLLTKLTDMEIDRFIEGNTKSEKRKEILSMIHTYKEKNPGFYEQLGHPYLLSQFLFLLESDRDHLPTTPLEITEQVLISLVQREENEKKNLSAKYIIPALKYVVSKKEIKDEFYITENDLLILLNEYRNTILEQPKDETYYSFDLITLITKLGIMKRINLDGFIFTQPSYYMAFLPRNIG